MFAVIKTGGKQYRVTGGQEITVENALKILMVKSANDVSTVVAEGVGGSVPGFSFKLPGAAPVCCVTRNWPPSVVRKSPPGTGMPVLKLTVSSPEVTRKSVDALT